MDLQAETVSLFDVEFWEVMVVQDCKEPLLAKLKRIFVPFELKHTALQGLRVYPSRKQSPPGRICNTHLQQ